jgi:hypothetical protein
MFALFEEIYVNKLCFALNVMPYAKFLPLTVVKSILMEWQPTHA